MDSPKHKPLSTWAPNVEICNHGCIPIGSTHTSRHPGIVSVLIRLYSSWPAPWQLLLLLCPRNRHVILRQKTLPEKALAETRSKYRRLKRVPKISTECLAKVSCFDNKSASWDRMFGCSFRRIGAQWYLRQTPRGARQMAAHQANHSFKAQPHAL